MSIKIAPSDRLLLILLLLLLLLLLLTPLLFDYLSAFRIRILNATLGSLFYALNKNRST
jgi:hypothetical protein